MKNYIITSIILWSLYTNTMRINNFNTLLAVRERKNIDNKVVFINDIFKDNKPDTKMCKLCIPQERASIGLRISCENISSTQSLKNYQALDIKDKNSLLKKLIKNYPMLPYEHERFHYALLVAAGANPNTAQVANENSLLSIAVSKNDYPMALLLLRFGANVNQESEGGKTPLFFAPTKNMAQLLIVYGANIHHRANALDSILMSHVLMHTDKKSLKLFQYLIDCGASIKIKNVHRDTLLHRFAQTAHRYCSSTVFRAKVRAAIKAGIVDINARNKNGDTANDIIFNTWTGLEDTYCDQFYKYDSCIACTAKLNSIILQKTIAKIRLRDKRAISF